MRELRDRRKIGQVLKIQFFWNYPSDPSVKLEDTSKVRTFSTKWTSEKSITLDKDDPSIVHKERIENGETVTDWFAYIDTTLLGPGNLRLEVLADIVDTDSPYDLSRPELCDCDTLITLYE